ncbi:MAG: ABC transporter permease [Chitinophagaceae bacterium]|nr:MAG: ABC transporter permease [Chitinophagaceae bacterium]
MGVASFIANRIAFNQQKSFSRFIIRLSIAATVISVAVMIVTLSFVNGFQETVSNKVFSFWGHVRVQYKQPAKAAIAEELAIEKNDTTVAAIKKDPRVVSIHPFATKYAILKTKDEMEGVLLKGFDPTYDFNHLKQFMQEGRWLDFSDTGYSKEIIISAYTAMQLKLKVNDSILALFVRPDEITPRVRKVSICGIYKTGIEDYDKTFGIADIRFLQRMNNWKKNEIGGYEIYIKDYTQMQKTSEDLYAMPEFPETWDAKSIRDIYPNIFDWLNMQNVTRDILIGFMTLVAVINLITCLIILVLERVRMVGVLKAVGASDWTVQKIFLRHSTLITIAGVVIGAVLGLGLLYLQQSTGFIKLKEEAYYMSTAAVKIIWWQIAAVCASTLLVCFLVLLIPTFIVKRVQPIKAIQFR